MSFSDYIIYVDESGDHSLTSIDKDYPLFVLAFCLVEKADYANVIVPAIQSFKFDHFGHDMVVLHAHEIRKSKNAFSFLLNPEKRLPFMEDLSGLMADMPYQLIVSAILKELHREKYARPWSPYTLALQFCMERAHDFLLENGQEGRTTHLVVESRGKREDQELELEFRRIIDNHYKTAKRHERDFSRTPFEIEFASKHTNSTGMQLADLVAHPIGRHVLDEKQDNRAYDVVRKKFIEKKVFP